MREIEGLQLTGCQELQSSTGSNLYMRKREQRASTGDGLEWMWFHYSNMFLDSNQPIRFDLI